MYRLFLCSCGDGDFYDGVSAADFSEECIFHSSSILHGNLFAHGWKLGEPTLPAVCLCGSSMAAGYWSAGGKRRHCLTEYFRDGYIQAVLRNNEFTVCFCRNYHSRGCILFYLSGLWEYNCICKKQDAFKTQGSCRRWWRKAGVSTQRRILRSYA